MPRKTDETPEVAMVEGDDAVTTGFEHPDADAVRNGELSAAQLPGGGGNVDGAEPDAQYPPGRIETLAPLQRSEVVPEDFVPDRSNRAAQNTSAAPDFE